MEMKVLGGLIFRLHRMLIMLDPLKFFFRLLLRQIFPLYALINAKIHNLVLIILYNDYINLTLIFKFIF
jgi:hypothetical protein